MQNFAIGLLTIVGLLVGPGIQGSLALERDISSEFAKSRAEASKLSEAESAAFRAAKGATAAK